MDEYEVKYLQVYTPCEEMGDHELIEALSICHTEFIIYSSIQGG